MITPQGGPTYYNRQVPPGRLPPNQIMPSGVPGTGFTSAGASRPDPLAGWVSPYAPLQSGTGGGPAAWIPPGSSGTSVPPLYTQQGGGGPAPWANPSGQQTQAGNPNDMSGAAWANPGAVSNAGGGQMTWPVPGEMPPKTGPDYGGGIKPPFSWPPAGQGKGTSDTVPAWLTPGEGVLNTGAAQLMGRNNIDQLNRTGQAVTGFQMGTGRVPPFIQNRVQNAMANHPFMQNFTPGQVAQHWIQRRQGGPGGGMSPMASGYEGGIGYVPPSSVDPAWQNINLQAPGMNIGALQQLAAQSRLSPTAISGLLQAVAQAYKRKQMQSPQDGTSYGGFMGQSSASTPSGYDMGTSDVKKKTLTR